MLELIKTELTSHLLVANKLVGNIEKDLLAASKLVTNTFKNGNKILVCGNGGSAADSQHIAAELVGRYKLERVGLPCIALTTDTSIITAIGNDYGYNRIFDRQVEALAKSGDLLIGISTSGNSANIINALKLAKKIGCQTLGFTGSEGENMNELCDVHLVAPSNDTPRIQEMHILFAHIICQIVDSEFKKIHPSQIAQESKS